jgi:Fe-S oxidoreductase
VRRSGRLAASIPGAAVIGNVVLQAAGISTVVKRLVGVDGRRPLPRLRSVRAKRAGAASLARVSAETLAGRPRVAVWVDSFSDTLEGTGLPALLHVLLAAGFAPHIIEQDACCGLTWITTGQHDGARAQLRHALDVLAPVAESGVPIVGLEPSCMSVWRSDAPELLPDDARVPVVAEATKTLAELLATVPDWRPPDLSGHTIVAQPHCHQASVLGWKADAALLARTGATVVTVGGCCGLAGNFGVEKGHYDVSVKVFEHDLGPAIEHAGPDAIILADGFSCRKQVADLTGRTALTLAQLLATHL